MCCPAPRNLDGEAGKGGAIFLHVSSRLPQPRLPGDWLAGQGWRLAEKGHWLGLAAWRRRRPRLPAVRRLSARLFMRIHLVELALRVQNQHVQFSQRIHGAEAGRHGKQRDAEAEKGKGFHGEDLCCRVPPAPDCRRHREGMRDASSAAAGAVCRKSRVEGSCAVRGLKSQESGSFLREVRIP